MQRAPTCGNCQRNFELRDYRPTGNRIPLLLPCGHTFCEGCLLKAARTKPEITCFTCNENVQLEAKGEAGVKTLLPNIYHLGLLLYNRRIASEKITGGAVSMFNGIGNLIYKSNPAGSHADGNPKEGQSQNESTLCDECNRHKATCQCKNCDDGRFCEKCFTKVHQSSKLLMKHHPLPLEFSNKEYLCCEIHKDRKLEFYDQQLKEAVCALCIISDKSRGHDVILLSSLNIKSDEKINDAVSKAKDTLFWLEHSRKVLTKALPEEYMEATQLFYDIHSKFNACHSILLKRQMELMLEASETLMTNGSIQNKFQEISDKARSLSTLLNDVEMVMQDKGVMRLQSEEVLQKLNGYIEEPCIIQRVPESEEYGFKLNVEDISITSLESIGSIATGGTSERYTFQKADDVSEELKEQLKNGIVPQEEIEEVQQNEITVEEDLDKIVKKSSLLSGYTGYNELVCVTDVISPVDFKVQRCADKDRLQVLMTNLNKYCRYANSHDDLVYTVEEGQLVCAQFLADNNWYRARILTKWSKESPDVLATWSNGLSVEVLYIDYGNSEHLALARLRKLPKEFLEIPEMAVSCTLCEIVPPVKCEDWPARSKKVFASLTGDRPMLMNIRKRLGCKLYVDLRKPDDDEPTHDDDRPISVRDALVFLQVASFISPASFPNSDMHQSVRKYKPPEPLVENGYTDVMVTHVEDPDSVYIQRLSSPIVDDQTRLGLIYNQKNKKAWLIDYPYRNLVCAAKFSADKTWYRAIVRNVFHDDTVEVEYVDYGNSEKIDFANIRKIPDMYLELPKQCIKVKLHDIEKPEGEEQWSEKSKQLLHRLFLGKLFVAVVKGEDNEVPVVDFYDTSTDEDIDVNDLLRKRLADKDGSLEKEEMEFAKLEEDLANLKLKLATESSVKDFPQYLPPEKMSSNKFSAAGVYVDDDATIYVHVMNGDRFCLNDVMKHLNNNSNEYTGHPKSTSKLNVNQGVIGKFSHDQLWYRVKILKIIDSKKVQIKFIDFGNTEEASVKHIYPKAMFSEIPAQCLGLKLANIEPLDSDGVFSPLVIELLRQSVVSKEVVVEIDENSCNKATIYVEGGRNLNNTLLKKKLVKKASKKANSNNERKNKTWGDIMEEEEKLINERKNKTWGDIMEEEEKLKKGSAAESEGGAHGDVGLYVSNIPLSLTQEKLTMMFSTTGNCKDVKICKALEGDETTYGLVIYGSLAEAEKAVTLFDEFVVFGKYKLQVKLYENLTASVYEMNKDVVVKTDRPNKNRSSMVGDQPLLSNGIYEPIKKVILGDDNVEKDSFSSKCAAVFSSAADNILPVADESEIQEFHKTSESNIIQSSPYLWYSEQKLPRVGMKFDVSVTQVNQPDIVYIQRLATEDSPGFNCEDETAEEAYNNLILLEEISQVINEDGYFGEEGLDVEPIVGMSCIGKYSLDGVYYRAQIDMLDKEEGVAGVTYIDYGTSEITPLESIKSMPPGLISLPTQATKVRIAGVKPCDVTEEGANMVKDTNWTVESMQQFYLMVANRRLLAEVVDHDGDLVAIHLYERFTSEDSGATVDLLIGEKMKKIGIADFDYKKEKEADDDLSVQ